MLNVRQVGRKEAGELIRAAFRRDPSHPETARRMARYLFANDALEELVAQLEPLLGDSVSDPECLHYLGLAASALGNHGLAESALSRAVFAGYADSRGPWARALFDLQKTSKAFAIATQTLAQDPQDDSAAQVVFKILLAGDCGSELWDLCWQLRAKGRWTPRMVSALAFAAHTSEQVAFVRRITLQLVWVEHKTLELEPGWLEQLAASLKASDLWTSLPRAKATVGNGRRIDALHNVVGNGWLDGIFRHIQAAVADYVEKRIDVLSWPSDEQPMAAMKPDHPTLTSWVVAVGGDGHEDWHVHPDGWLSGVFYVDVPDLSASDAPNAGQVEFGPFPLADRTPTAAWPGWMFTPRTGDLILFPSYIAHRTWPTHMPRERVCIAFDVLRRGIESTTASTSLRSVPPKIGPDERISRDRRAVSVPDGGGGQVLMNVESGGCLSLDDTGALIWSLLQTPRTVSGMVSVLARDFAGSEVEIHRDVSDALTHMISCGVAVVA